MLNNEAWSYGSSHGLLLFIVTSIFRFDLIADSISSRRRKLWFLSPVYSYIIYIFFCLCTPGRCILPPPPFSTADRRPQVYSRLRLPFTARAVGTQNVCKFAFFFSPFGVCPGCCIIWCQFIFCLSPRASFGVFDLLMAPFPIVCRRPL